MQHWEMAASPFDKILEASNLEIFRYEWMWNKATGYLNAKRLTLHTVIRIGDNLSTGRII